MFHPKYDVMLFPAWHGFYICNCAMLVCNGTIARSHGRISFQCSSNELNLHQVLLIVPSIIAVKIFYI